MTAPLTARMRAFADTWSGAGTGKAAARAAGYQGSDATLEVRASQLLRHPAVRARIEARLGLEALAAAAAAQESAPPEPGPALVKGRGRGTATERVELLMAIGRSKKATPRERVQAILAAAELEGERKPVRARGGRQPMIPLPAVPVVPSSPPKLSLVLNPKDQAGG